MDDHDKPFAAQGTTGRLIVLNGLQQSEAALTPAGDNRLQASGVRIAAGSKLLALLTLPGGKVVTVRFAAK